MSEGSDSNIDATAKSEKTKKKNKNKDAINMDSIKEKPAEKVQTKSLLNSRTEVKRDSCDWKKSGKISQDTFNSLYRSSAYMLSYSQIPPPPTVTIKTNKKSEKKRKTKRSKSFHNGTLSQTSETESTQYQDPPVEHKILPAKKTSDKTAEKTPAVKDFKSKNDSIDSKTSEPRIKLKSAGYPNRKFDNERQGLYENRRTYQSMENVIGPIHKEIRAYINAITTPTTRNKRNLTFLAVSNRKQEVDLHQEFQFVKEICEEMKRVDTHEHAPVEEFFYQRF